MDRIFHPCETSDWTRGPLGVFVRRYYKSSPLRKFFVILTFPQGHERARCEHCNLAFMHFLFEIFALFQTNFAERKTSNSYSEGKKMRNACGHQGKNERQRQKPTGTLDFSKSPLRTFFSRLVIPF